MCHNNLVDDIDDLSDPHRLALADAIHHLLSIPNPRRDRPTFRPIIVNHSQKP